MASRFGSASLIRSSRLADVEQEFRWVVPSLEPQSLLGGYHCSLIILSRDASDKPAMEDGCSYPRLDIIQVINAGSQKD